MADQRVLERIAGWEHDGLIDAATADRLRAAEGQLPLEAAPANVTAPEPPARGSNLQGFGLSLDVGEAFAYLGSFFVLGAWYWFIVEAARNSDIRDTILAIGALVPAVVFAGLGVTLDGRPGRIGRSTGLWFLLSGIHFFAGAPLAVSAIAPAGTFSGDSGLGDYQLLFGSLVWLGCAVAFRALHASVPTNLGLIAAIITTASAGADRVGQLLVGSRDYFEDPLRTDGAIPWLVINLSATILATVGIGLLARRETQSPATDMGAARRLAMARGFAGTTLAVGTAITTLGGGGGFGRPVEPIVADVMLLIVAAVLSALAINRRASAYIYPTGLAVLISLTDLNAEYLSKGIGIGPALLVEGLALIAVGFAAQKGRRWLNRRPEIDEAAPPAAVSSAATSPE